MLAGAAPAAWSLLEIRQRLPSLTYFAKPPPRCSPAFVSELVCRCPSKAGQTARGDGVRMHGGKLPARVYWSRKEWMG